MSNVYILYYHGDEFYALVDSAWTAAKCLWENGRLTKILFWWPMTAATRANTEHWAN